MKQEKGVTTASIIVYVIIITIAISLLSLLTGFFRNSLNKNLRKDNDYEQYITFVKYFVQDVQEEGNRVLATQGIQGRRRKWYFLYSIFKW